MDSPKPMIPSPTPTHSKTPETSTPTTASATGDQSTTDSKARPTAPTQRRDKVEEHHPALLSKDSGYISISLENQALLGESYKKITLNADLNEEEEEAEVLEDGQDDEDQIGRGDDGKPDEVDEMKPQIHTAIPEIESSHNILPHGTAITHDKTPENVVADPPAVHAELPTHENQGPLPTLVGSPIPVVAVEEDGVLASMDDMSPSNTPACDTSLRALDTRELSCHQDEVNIPRFAENVETPAWLSQVQPYAGAQLDPRSLEMLLSEADADDGRRVRDPVLRPASPRPPILFSSPPASFEEEKKTPETIPFDEKEAEERRKMEERKEMEEISKMEERKEEEEGNILKEKEDAMTVRRIEMDARTKSRKEEAMKVEDRNFLLQLPDNHVDSEKDMTEEEEDTPSFKEEKPLDAKYLVEDVAQSPREGDADDEKEVNKRSMTLTR